MDQDRLIRLIIDITLGRPVHADALPPDLRRLLPKLRRDVKRIKKAGGIVEVPAD